MGQPFRSPSASGEKIYDKAVGTWGEGLIQLPNEELYDVVRSLMDKCDGENADLTEELAARHEAIEAGSDGLSRLEATLAVARETYRKRATALNKQRIAAAAKLDAAVAQELAPLKLDSARFRTVVSPMPELQWVV